MVYIFFDFFAGLGTETQKTSSTDFSSMNLALVIYTIYIWKARFS